MLTLVVGVVIIDVGGTAEVGVACNLDGFTGRVCFGGRPRGFPLPMWYGMVHTCTCTIMYICTEVVTAKCRDIIQESLRVTHLHCC